MFNLLLFSARTYAKEFDEIISIYLQQIESNNSKTNHYGLLIEHFVRLATNLREDFSDQSLLKQTTNALFILRCLTKYFIEINSELNLNRYFLPQEHSIDHLSLMTIFIDILFRTTIYIPVNSSTYNLHLEILNILIVLLAVQMCAKEATFISSIYSIFMHRLE